MLQGGLLLGGLMGAGDVPNDPNIERSASNISQTGNDALAWYKNIDAESKPAYDQAIQTSLANARSLQGVADTQTQQGKDAASLYQTSFRPISERIAKEAQEYDTPQRRDQAAAQAQADIGTAGEAERANTEREILSRGGDVNSGNFQAALAGNATRTAVAKGAGGNLARRQVEATGAARLADAANLGTNIQQTGNQNTQLGLTATSLSNASAAMPGALTAQRASTMGQGFQTSIGADNMAGNLLLGQYSAKNKANTSNAGILAGVGKGVGGLF
jgi:hypothetical protein